MRAMSFAVIFAACLLVGCGEQNATAKSAAKPKVADAASILSLDGPGGRVKIGDGLDAAKSAFPAPKGAESSDSALGFAMFGDAGWSWQIPDEDTSFEAATKGGKIVALATGSDKIPTAADVSQEIARIGEPTRKAEGKVASMYVWESGESARFYLVVKEKLALFGGGSATIIGPKEDLKLMQFRHDDPTTFVRQLDMVAEQMKDGKPNPIFEEAKKKALEKAKASKESAEKGQ